MRRIFAYLASLCALLACSSHVSTAHHALGATAPATTECTVTATGASATCYATSGANCIVPPGSVVTIGLPYTGATGWKLVATVPAPSGTTIAFPLVPAGAFNYQFSAPAQTETISFVSEASGLQSTAFAVTVSAAAALTVADVRLYGADATGASDSGPASQNTVNALASTGIAAHYPGGTFLIATEPGIAVPQGGQIVLTPGTTIHQNLTGGHAAPLDAWLYQQAVDRAAAGTLAANVTLYSQTFSVNLTTKPLVGDWLLLQAIAPSTAGKAVYSITSVSGSSSPYTIGVERPVVWPFLMGDGVTEASAIPNNITVHGNGAIVSGTADQFIEWGAGMNLFADHLRMNTNLGLVNQGGVGLDNGCVDSTVANSSVDLTGTTATSVAAFYSQSGERVIFDHDRASGLSSDSEGFELIDCYQCGVSNSWAYGQGGEFGVSFGTLGSTFPGCVDSWAHGGGAVGMAAGVAVYNSTGTKVSDLAVEGTTGESGVYVDSTATGTVMANVSARNGAGTGFSILSDAQLTDIDASYNAGASGLGQQAAIYVNANSSTVDVHGLNVQLSPGQAEAAVWVDSGNLRIKHATIASTVVAGWGVYVHTSGRVEVDGASIALTGASGTKYDIRVATGTAVVKNTVASGSNCIGLYVASGATAIVGEGNDFSGCATPMLIGGTVTVLQHAGITAADSTTALVLSQLQNDSIESSGNSSGTVTITAASNNFTDGMQWTCRNNNTGSSTTTFFGITVATGKSAIVRVNSSGNGERVTPDT